MTTIINEPEVRPFIISRIFDAPRELVWKAWTERERLMQWFGPKGCTMPVAKMDVRVGGTCHSCLRTPDGREMWGKFIYREITAPERLVYVQHFSDAAGGITRHPLNPVWPLQMLTTITFAEQNRKTLLTVRWTPLEPTDEERQTFDGGHEGMKHGWGGSFDQLADYLVKVETKGES
ncbi:MAG: SRPBCC family protein [Limisphaerales bacterium]